MQSKIITNWNRVLVTCPHNLGDFIAKLPLIRLLKKEKPKCEILLCCRGYLKDLVKSIEEVDQFLDFEILFQQDNNKIIQTLKDLNIDTIIHLLSVQRSLGPHVLGYAKQAGITNRIGNLNKSALSCWMKRNQHSMTHNLKQKRIIENLHEFQWNLLPLKFFGIDKQFSAEALSPLLKVNVKEKINFPFLSKDKFNLILHPGSNGNAKEWPMIKYKELIKLLDKDQFNILITGSKDEAIKYKDLDLKEEKIHFLMGQFVLKEFISLISQSEGLVAASTGPIHIASLFETHILGLFPRQKEIGPDIWRPLGENATFLAAPEICLACEKKITDFNLSLCSCMEKIKVSDVKDRITLWRSQ